jgi:hypothetical protein
MQPMLMTYPRQTLNHQVEITWQLKALLSRDCLCSVYQEISKATGFKPAFSEGNQRQICTALQCGHQSLKFKV